jgi:epoxyqueuosine reductase
VHAGGLALPWPVETPEAPSVRGRDCGRCRRCLTACPTGALAAERTVDARRCISWLTLECRGEVPDELKPLMGRWIAGCDACQEPCPWVRSKSRPAGVPYLRFDADLHAPRLAEVLALDEAGFRARYHGTVLARTGLARLRRNAAIALANA